MVAAFIMAWLKGVPPMRSQKTRTPSQEEAMEEMASATFWENSAASDS